MSHNFRDFDWDGVTNANKCILKETFWEHSWTFRRNLPANFRKHRPRNRTFCFQMVIIRASSEQLIWGRGRGLVGDSKSWTASCRMYWRRNLQINLKTASFWRMKATVQVTVRRRAPWSTPRSCGASRRTLSFQRLAAGASGTGLKGSIGEGSNHSNFSHQSLVKILSKFSTLIYARKFKKFRIFQHFRKY